MFKCVIARKGNVSNINFQNMGMETRSLSIMVSISFYFPSHDTKQTCLPSSEVIWILNDKDSDEWMLIYSSYSHKIYIFMPKKTSYFNLLLVAFPQTFSFNIKQQKVQVMLLAKILEKAPITFNNLTYFYDLFLLWTNLLNSNLKFI